uniref:Uncharacterized protein n=1 Tax=Rhizophora mucronata TaxID=61149 RepID=A0A2P2NX38_RHIMU
MSLMMKMIMMMMTSLMMSWRPLFHSIR